MPPIHVGLSGFLGLHETQPQQPYGQCPFKNRKHVVIYCITAWTVL